MTTRAPMGPQMNTMFDEYVKMRDERDMLRDERDLWHAKYDELKYVFFLFLAAYMRLSSG